MYYEGDLSIVHQHHICVEALGHPVVFTALIGSQNYNLHDKNSDYDTFSLVLPTLDDIIYGREPVAGEFEIDDGKCMYKDIRAALALLKKASPNSTEMFATPYKIYNDTYYTLVKKYIGDSRDRLFYMLHCNYKHMLYACAGMAHQLVKRNMPAGKRYSHALRLMELVDNYTNMYVRNSDTLFTVNEPTRTKCLEAKRDKDNDNFYNSECIEIANKLDFIRDTFVLTPAQEAHEKVGINLINEFQTELLKAHLETIT